MRNLILFNLILLFSLNSKADMADIKETYMEVLNTIKLYCRPDQYFNPTQKTLSKAFLESPIIGLCETDKHSYYNISIDVPFWTQATKDIQYELMAHEMSHCLFFRNHVDNKNNFMYSVIRNLTKEETLQQLIDNLNEDCGAKNGK